MPGVEKDPDHVVRDIATIESKAPSGCDHQLFPLPRCAVSAEASVSKTRDCDARGGLLTPTRNADAMSCHATHCTKTECRSHTSSARYDVRASKSPLCRGVTMRTPSMSSTSYATERNGERTISWPSLRITPTLNSHICQATTATRTQFMNRCDCPPSTALATPYTPRRMPAHRRTQSRGPLPRTLHLPFT